MGATVAETERLNALGGASAVSRLRILSGDGLIGSVDVDIALAEKGPGSDLSPSDSVNEGASDADADRLVGDTLPSSNRRLLIDAAADPGYEPVVRIGSCAVAFEMVLTISSILSP